MSTEDDFTVDLMKAQQNKMCRELADIECNKLKEEVFYLREALAQAEEAIDLVLNSDMAQREEDEGNVSETLACVRQARYTITKLKDYQ